MGEEKFCLPITFKLSVTRLGHKRHLSRRLSARTRTTAPARSAAVHTHARMRMRRGSQFHASIFDIKQFNSNIFLADSPGFWQRSPLYLLDPCTKHDEHDNYVCSIHNIWRILPQLAFCLSQTQLIYEWLHKIISSGKRWATEPWY